MRFLSATAYAFGPFRGDTIEFGPDFNLVIGPNEAGKSSWHAALFAGLCGMRRGRGRQRDDQVFTDRHRPWEGDEWRVGVVIELADRRRVEILRDLAGSAGTSAVEVDLGRDCAGEIIRDGTPDGAAWLGLDRRSFVATACIRQGQLLEVLAGAEPLQEALQRATESVGTESTAAVALAVDEHAAYVDLLVEENRLSDEEQRLSEKAERESSADVGADFDTAAMEEALEKHRERVNELTSRRRRPLELVSACVLMAAALLCFVLGQTGMGVVSLGLAMGVVLWSMSKAGGRALGRGLDDQGSADDLDELEARLAEVRRSVAERRRQDEARQRKLTEVARRRASVEGQRRECERRLPSVADAEEALGMAEADRERMRDLKTTLETTREYLSRARDQAHQNIAPVLAREVRQRLVVVAGERYDDVRVDPLTLNVQVHEVDGHWRDATLLSHGTAEQVDLLLRVALAEHVTRGDEICPLILDDAFVHCDAVRKRALLGTLMSVSDERQVIVFSQELEVLEWARERLVGPGSRIFELSAPSVNSTQRAPSAHGRS